ALRAVKYQNTSEAPSTGSRTVSMQANDGSPLNNLSNQATRTIVVTPVNDAPVANDDTLITSQNTPAEAAGLGHAAEAGGTLGPATVATTGAATHGTAVANPDGTITYTPAAGFVGSDSFRYTVKDNAAATSNEATVAVTVGAVNHAPVGTDDGYATDEDTVLTV